MQLLIALLIRLPLVLFVALATTVLPGAASAQNLFSPAIVVNDSVVTYYELDQRTRMNQVLNAPGNPAEAAREQLIDDRIRLQAVQQAGIVLSEEDVLDGMSEFAGRANLTREEFVQALEGAGVAEQTFRDFVRAGLGWRELVQARFVGQVNITDTEIDRALSSGAGSSNVRVLLSEIIMPAPPQEAEAVRARAERISQITSEAAFSAEARRYSATQSRANGGRLPWQDLSELPPQLRPILLGLAPGEVTDPLPLNNAVALFQLRAIEEADYSGPEVAAVEYAAYYMPGGRSPETLARARVLASQVDRCDDLYAVAQGQPPEVLDRGSLPPSEIPTDIAFELSKLDPGEVSTALTRSNGQTLVFLMLCKRTAAVNADVAPEDVEAALTQRKLSVFADSELAQLRANALIVEK